jgi:carboxymethylenebutenolidase
VLHAWWGLTPVFTDVCDRLAAEGFVALAPGLYPDGATTDSIAEAEKLVDAHDRTRETVEGIILASEYHLRQLPAVTSDQIGVVGFSMGAWWALRLSQLRPDHVGAAVTFYGTGGGDFSAAQAAYQGHFAEQDDFEPLEEVRTLEESIRAAGREVEFYTYPNTGHWFFEANRPDAYNAEAATLAWDRMIAFLRAQLV